MCLKPTLKTEPPDEDAVHLDNPGSRQPSGFRRSGGCPIVNSFGLAARQPPRSPSASLNFAQSTFDHQPIRGLWCHNLGHEYNSRRSSAFPRHQWRFSFRRVHHGSVPAELWPSRHLGRLWLCQEPDHRSRGSAAGQTESFSRSHKQLPTTTPNTAFLGFSGISFDAIRVTAGTPERVWWTTYKLAPPTRYLSPPHWACWHWR